MTKQFQEKQVNFAFEIKELSEDGSFSGYGSTYGNVDLDRDVIEKGAFSKSLKRKALKSIKLLWQHDTRQPIGVWKKIYEDDKGLVVEGKLILDVEQGREAYALMKAGAIDSMSAGFMVNPNATEYDSKRKVRIIKEIDLWEVSIVTFPANPKAKIQRVKSVAKEFEIADKGYIWNQEEAHKRVMGLDDYKNSFLYYDEENEKGYLPVCDVVNGKLTVIPKALFAAAGALIGKEIDIPDTEKPRIISNVEKYYNKMGMESPFNTDKDAVKSFIPALLQSAETAKEYEKTLRDVGFSTSEAKAITAKIGPQREVEASVANKLDEAATLLNQLT